MQHLFLSSGEMVAARGTIPSLDGLRAVSIMLVIAAHFWAPDVVPGGLGVYIFFVISGFLITRLLLAEYKSAGRISVTNFYTRRALRLYPVILVYIAFVIIMQVETGRPYNLLEPLSALAYFANYFYTYKEFHHLPTEMPFGPFWSLSVEEHFYILFPVVFLLFRGNPKRVMVALAAMCAACLGVRMLVAWMHPEYLGTTIFYSQSQYRLDSIAFGVMLALACEMEAGRLLLKGIARPISALMAVLVLLTCLLVRDPWFRETFRYTIQGLAITVLVATVLFSANMRLAQRVLNCAVLVWVGRLSYSLYIWHEGVASFLPEGSMPPWQLIAAKLVAALMVATLSFYLIEQPVMRLRRHLPRLMLALKPNPDRHLQPTPGA